MKSECLVGERCCIIYPIVLTVNLKEKNNVLELEKSRYQGDDNMYNPRGTIFEGRKF